MSEVGHDGDFEGDAESAKLSEGVRGDLKDEEFGAGLGDFGDTLVEGVSINGGHMTKFGL